MFRKKNDGKKPADRSTREREIKTGVDLGFDADFRGFLDDLITGVVPEKKDRSTIIEVPPPTPLVWQMPRQLDAIIRQYRTIMDKNFPELKGNEVGIMPIYEGDNLTDILDVMIFRQTVCRFGIDYTPLAQNDVYSKIEKENESSRRLRTLGGMIHFHPEDCSTQPSPVDLETFEQITWDNMNYQDFFGYVEATEEFAKVTSEEDIRKALEDKDAAIFAQDTDQGIDGAKITKIYFKVRFGYSVFMIYNGDEGPWIGVGECKEYCFDGGPKSYRLLRPEDGQDTRLILTDASTHHTTDEEIIRKEIADNVKPQIYIQPTRSLHLDNILDSSDISTTGYQATIVQRLEEQMPATAEEMMSLLGHFLQLAEKDGNPDIEAIRRVHDIFSGIYKDDGDYKEQLEKATTLLRKISPTYDRARKIIEEE